MSVSASGWSACCPPSTRSAFFPPVTRNSSDTTGRAAADCVARSRDSRRGDRSAASLLPPPAVASLLGRSARVPPPLPPSLPSCRRWCCWPCRWPTPDDVLSTASSSAPGGSAHTSTSPLAWPVAKSPLVHPPSQVAAVTWLPTCGAVRLPPLRLPGSAAGVLSGLTEASSCCALRSHTEALLAACTMSRRWTGGRDKTARKVTWPRASSFWGETLGWREAE
jgi:hypothetical protein